MNTYLNTIHEPFTVGAILSRSKGPVSHKVLYVGFGKVAELLPSGIKFRTLAESFKGHTPVVDKPGLPEAEHGAFYQRLRDAMNKNAPYALIWNNCEHFVSSVRDGIRKSPQAKTGLILFALGLLWYLNRSR